MKHIFIVSIGILSLGLIFTNAFAQDAIFDSYKDSDLVLVGKVVSLSEVTSASSIQMLGQT